MDLKKKSYKGCYWNSWGNLNMGFILDNVFESVSDFWCDDNIVVCRRMSLQEAHSEVCAVDNLV